MNNKSLKMVALAIIIVVGVNRIQINKHTIATNNYILAQAHFIQEVVNNQNNLTTKPNNKYVIELLNSMVNQNSARFNLVGVEIQTKIPTYHIRRALTIINNLSYKIQNGVNPQLIEQDFNQIKQLVSTN